MEEDLFRMNNLPAKTMDIICIDNVDMIETEKGLIGLNDLLSWDGLMEEMKKGEQIELDVNHIFSGGVYIRELSIPRGVIIVGKVHRHETCNVLLKGTLSVFLGSGKPVQKITGPLMMTSEPMTRKIAYCHDDAIFMNIHPTTETNIEKIEAEFIVPESEVEKITRRQLCLGQQ
jgi:hypothetical protein